MKSREYEGREDLEPQSNSSPAMQYHVGVYLVVIAAHFEGYHGDSRTSYAESSTLENSTSGGGGMIPNMYLLCTWVNTNSGE